MAISNVPTTEKRTKQRTAEAKQESRVRFGWLIALVLLSIMAGFFAGVLSRVYPSNWPFASLLYVAQSGYDTGSVLFVQPEGNENVINTLDIIERQQSATIVEVYPAATTEFTEDALLSYGMIVSADGWLAVPLQAVTNSTEVEVVLQDGRVFTSEEIVPDKYSNIAYVAISANQLPIADFTDDSIELGESTVVYRRSSEQGPTVKKAIVEDTMITKATFSTEEFPYLIGLDTQFGIEAPYLGAAVFDATGSIVGMVTDVDTGTIVAAAAIANPLYGLFQTNAIERHSIQITYDPVYQGVNLASSEGAQAEVRRNGVSVISVSGVGEADIQVGDIIKRVNGEVLSIERDFSQFLSEQPIESVVQLEIDRTDEAGEVSSVTTELTIQ